MLDFGITKASTPWITARVQRSKFEDKANKTKRAIKQFKSFIVYAIGCVSQVIFNFIRNIVIFKTKFQFLIQ